MTTSPSPKGRPNPWIVRGAASQPVRSKLFCIPHAGGTAGMFRGWRKALPAHVELCAVQLPGRLSHLNAPAFTRMEPLADSLAEVILADTDGLPFALFGHCTGALLAYEVGQRLEARHRGPTQLFVACARPPHLVERDPPVSHLPEADLVAALRVMGGTPPELLASPPMLRVMLPAVRADFAVSESYCFAPRPALDCDALVFGATADGVSRCDLESWATLFRGRTTVLLCAGGHFLLDTAESVVVEAIAHALAGPRGQGAGDPERAGDTAHG
jgi:medium-chain acyl-[acyl-carrier-protein] hydrolase